MPLWLNARSSLVDSVGVFLPPTEVLRGILQELRDGLWGGGGGGHFHARQGQPRRVSAGKLIALRAPCAGWGKLPRRFVVVVR